MNIAGSSARYEPGANGNARYIGWRTTAYNPLLVTVCSVSTSTVRAA